MIFVTGDCHGYMEKFSTNCFPEQKYLTKDDVVIICGDFGLVWDQEETKPEKYWLDWLNEKPFTTVFVDGNHENHLRLNQFPQKEWNGGKVHEIRSNIFHLIRGEIYLIEGKKFFAFGGASSHDIQDGILDGNDKHWKEKAKELTEQGKYMFRVKGLSWWEEELPSQEEMDNGIRNLQKHNFKVDYVISHCAPTFVQAYMSYGTYQRDILTDYFQSLIYDKGLEFTQWAFGHYHDDANILDKFVLLYDQISEIPTERYKFHFDDYDRQNI